MSKHAGTALSPPAYSLSLCPCLSDIPLSLLPAKPPTERCEGIAGAPVSMRAPFLTFSFSSWPRHLCRHLCPPPCPLCLALHLAVALLRFLPPGGVPPAPQVGWPSFPTGPNHQTVAASNAVRTLRLEVWPELRAAAGHTSAAAEMCHRIPLSPPLPLPPLQHTPPTPSPPPPPPPSFPPTIHRYHAGQSSQSLLPQLRSHSNEDGSSHSALAEGSRQDCKSHADDGAAAAVCAEPHLVKWDVVWLCGSGVPCWHTFGERTRLSWG